VGSEVLNLNEVTLWSGGPSNKTNPNGPTILAKVREALAAGQYKEADSLVRFMETKNSECYEPLGNIELSFDHNTGYTNYSRELNLDKAIVTVKYKVDGVNYTREVFASHPDEAIVMRIYGDRKGSVDFDAVVNTQLQGKIRKENNTIIIDGRAPSHDAANPKVVEWDEHKGMRFESRLNIKTSGGKITDKGDGLRVAGADTAVLIFSAATSFNGFDQDPLTQGKDCQALVKGYIAKASVKTYQRLLSDHIKDYQSLFRRLWVEVNNEKPNKTVLAYQYARYELIACSRPGGGAPRNEQGIWNRDVSPHYSSNYTLNENPEKYYSLAEPANIGETTQPLIGYIGDLAVHGAVTAKIDYGFHGWVTHHNSDIWAMSEMATGDPCWADWPVGGIWLTQTVYERWAFSRDQKYLRTTAYPIMKGAATFALDLLVTNKDGYLVTSPSTSPENHFIDANGTRVAVSEGSTMDMSLLRELFQHCIQESAVLGIDANFSVKLKTALAKFLPYKIGTQGQLNEFEFDFTNGIKEWEPNHRHASHLISVWPLSQINKNTPELLAAAHKSLELRGSGGYHPDKAGMWARLLDGDRCLAYLNLAKYPTLYDAPPAGFSEMLLQSQTGDLDILPALPTSWASGKILGIRARGNYELDIEWVDHQLKKATIRSYSGRLPIVTVMGKPVNYQSDPRISFQIIK
jgi:alpha-L-fucosidase 2